ncbi:helix-turn-helix domain-containing protein [uncultured Roseovarius sp.]|uniref:helix-turn-helix domain-containing protein n=1 Tax=Roseovarius sp. TaxID=1486281 RepID=UPI0025EA6C5C|nr:helix-turn-helix domain-containing protein [uncultured Roseovarius sp.]
MYLDALTSERSNAGAALHSRRSLSGDFLFVSQGPAMAFAAEACIDVLRSANRLLGRESYTWDHVCGVGGLAGIEGCGPDQTLVLVGGIELAWRPVQEDIVALRRAIRNAARVCLVGSAVFVPLAAGVLGARQLAVHPDFRPGVQETSRRIEFSDQTTCHHKALSSAISPAAAVQMMVELVGARDGEFTRTSLARYLGLSEPGREAPASEHLRYHRLAQGDATLNGALQIMLEHLEDTLSVGQIADLLGVSARKLERGFGDLLRQTPLNVYRDLRLDRARRLLTQTAMPMNEVSVACGFSNVSLMKKWFVQKYGEAPEAVRRQAFGALQPA